MKKSVWVFLAAISAFCFLSACGSDGTGEFKLLMTDQVDVMENFIEGMEKAQNPEEMAAAIETYTEGMKKVILGLREFQKKYPEFEKGVMPKDLEEEMKRAENVSAKIPAVMMNSVRFMMDAKVQKAMSKMTSELGESE